jgi:hypothetical protein
LQEKAVFFPNFFMNCRRLFVQLIFA